MTNAPPSVAYVAESGFQHLYPILSMQRTLPAPVLTTGRRMAARLAATCDAVFVQERDLPSAILDRGLDIVVSTSQRLHPRMLSSRSPRVRVVFIGHGESDKTHGQGADPKPGFVHAPVNDAFDLLLVGSTAHLDAYSNPRRVLVGDLKHDLFMHGGYANRRPLPGTVLWAPSWGRHNSVPEWLTRVVEATGRLGLTCLLQPHPFSFEAEPHVVQQAYALSIRNPHFRVVEAANVLDTMARCELMLGDVSTVCYDWLLFDRPIVFLDHPSLSVPEEKRLFGAGICVGPGDDVEAALRQALTRPDAHALERRSALEGHFPWRDGRAAQRCAEAIGDWWRTCWSSGP